MAKDAPKFANNTISMITEGIIDLYRKITAGIIICGTLLILWNWVVHRQNPSRGSDHILVFITRLLRGHLQKLKAEENGGKGLRRMSGQVGLGVSWVVTGVTLTHNITC